MDKRKEVLFFLLGILILGIILAIIFVFQGQRNSISADSEIYAGFSLSPSSSEIGLGECEKIEIIVDGDILSKEAQVELKYDPQVLEIIDQDASQEGIQIDAGNIYNNYYENSVDPEKGIIFISAASSYPVIINTPRIFATFYIKVLKDFTSTNINFVFEKGKTSESNLFCSSSDEDETEKDCLQGVLNCYLENKE